MKSLDRGAGLGARALLGDAGRVIFLAALLAGLVFLFFSTVGEQSSDPLDLGHRPAISGPEVRVKVPELDRELLAKVRDETRAERLVIDRDEQEPLRHLLAKSAGIQPETARALGRPEEPVPIERVRAEPDNYRGRYLMYRGTLIHKSPPREGHPLDGYRIHEGAVQVGPDDDIVFFAVSEPIGDEIGEGSFVEIEGFFFGLRDSNVIVDAERAPMLVGPGLDRAMRSWDPVEELDPDILAAVRDGRFEEGRFTDVEQLRVKLSDVQNEILWHLASYARTQDERTDLAHWREIPTFGSDEQFQATKHGTFERGQPVRILGEFIFSEWQRAETNPIGVDAWSEVWVQVPDLQGKVVPIWIPKRIENWERGDLVEAQAYYFRRISYGTRLGERYSPVFVAADLHRYEPVRHVELALLGWVFFAIVVGVIVFVFWMSFGDRARRRKHEQEMAARRKKHFERDLHGATA